jgi:hypothetical protein
MPWLRSDYLSRLQVLLNTGTSAYQDQLNIAIDEALEEHASFRPRTVSTVYLNVDAYLLALPLDWENGFSQIIAVEHPINRPPDLPCILDKNDYWIYQENSTLYLALKSFNQGKDLRLIWTKRHVLTNSESSIPEYEQVAFLHLAASYACHNLAQVYALTEDPLIRTEVLNFRSRVDEYRRLEADYRASYFRLIGLSEDGESWGLEKKTMLDKNLLIRLSRWKVSV